jgi:opacity protein-like surface antigen
MTGNGRGRALALGLAMGLPLLGGASAKAESKIKLYAGLQGSYATVMMHSGGFNTIGDFRNRGDDTGTLVLPSGHIGLEWNRMIRLDFSYHRRGGLNFTTSGFSWDFPYRSTIDTVSLMASVLVKIVPKGAVSPYLGAGLGQTAMEGTATDLVVQGSASAKRLSWQAEAGIQFDPLRLVSFQLGYRIASLGRLDIPLTESGLAAGDFTAALKTGELVVGARIKI